MVSSKPVSSVIKIQVTSNWIAGAHAEGLFWRTLVILMRLKL